MFCRFFIDRPIFAAVLSILITLAGGTSVYVDTYPEFAIDPDKVRAALTPRTKAIIVNSPANPTGVVYARDTLRALAELARFRYPRLRAPRRRCARCRQRAMIV